MSKFSQSIAAFEELFHFFMREFETSNLNINGKSESVPSISKGRAGWKHPRTGSMEKGLSYGDPAAKQRRDHSWSLWRRRVVSGEIVT